MTSHSIKLTCSFVVAVFVIVERQLSTKSFEAFAECSQRLRSGVPLLISRNPENICVVDESHSLSIKLQLSLICASKALCVEWVDSRLWRTQMERKSFHRFARLKIKPLRQRRRSMPDSTFKQIVNSEIDVRSKIKMFSDCGWNLHRTPANYFIRFAPQSQPQITGISKP